MAKKNKKKKSGPKGQAANKKKNNRISNTRVAIEYRIELESDAILGSGYSIAGGADINVCKDKDGYPFVKGSTLKGLLREAMELYLKWTESGMDKLDAILGNEDWYGEAGERRLYLSEAVLEEKPENPEECYSNRAFTSIENGVSKEGSLREAECIKKGLVFVGNMECHSDDFTVLQKSLKAVKWMGTLRNRGFGKISIDVKKKDVQKQNFTLQKESYIHYQIQAEAPIAITDLSKSKENAYETKAYITGSAIRGSVIGQLALEKGFEDIRKEILSDQVRFYDAIPVVDTEKTAIPSFSGFYEDKAGTKFASVLKDGNLEPGLKRASVGEFCIIQDGRIQYWSGKTNGVTRIKKGNEEDTKMFQTRYLEAGQIFDGYIKVSNPELAEKIKGVFEKNIWVGADRFEGFGKCKTIAFESVKEPAYYAEYGCKTQEEVGKELYMVALSPVAMLDKYGTVCGIDWDAVAEQLGISGIEEQPLCSTNIGEYGGYNRTWQCEVPLTAMYKKGSIFKIQCKEEPSLEKIKEVQQNGLGIRKSEGFGNILFLSKQMYESIQGKQAMAVEVQEEAKKVRQLRQARIRWIMDYAEHPQKWIGKMSDSQLGEIQIACKQGEDSVLKLLEHKQSLGADNRVRYEVFRSFFEDFMQSDKFENKLEMLQELIDFSRRVEDKQ